MIRVQEGCGFVIPIRKTTNGFRTAWGDLENETPDLPDDIHITRIDSEIDVETGAIGRGYVKVEVINESSSGAARYVQVRLKQFQSEKQATRSDSAAGTTYTSHVARSHNDTATPRANQGGMPFAPSSKDR